MNTLITDKTKQLQRDVQSNTRRRELQCGKLKVGDIVIVRGLITEYGKLDAALVMKSVMDGVGRFSGYTTDGNLIGEYRWSAKQIESLETV